MTKEATNTALSYIPYIKNIQHTISTRSGKIALIATIAGVVIAYYSPSNERFAFIYVNENTTAGIKKQWFPIFKYTKASWYDKLLGNILFGGLLVGGGVSFIGLIIYQNKNK
jgi:hypothetical protein